MLKQKIALKRAELRDKKGKFHKHDIFLLTGDYPSGWSMVKDLLLCLFLFNLLISTASKIDLSYYLGENVVVVSNTVINPVEAKNEPVSAIVEDVELLGEFSAYTADVAQTDADPFTMANGKKVFDGAIANNCLPFGTKIKIAGKVYTVSDRMNSRYGCKNFDIYFEDYSEAIKFGRKSLRYEVIHTP